MSRDIQRGWLAVIERAGNRLPDPAILFVIGTAVVIILAQLSVWLDWQIDSQAVDGSNQYIQANSVLSSEGIWWWLSTLVKNFIEFPPLGIVLVGMLGIGLAERCGLLPALIVFAGRAIKQAYLIPAIIFVGIMSSLALDAGYVVLPPIAAVLFMSMGYSPVLGIVAAFAGVSAGFGANLFITSIDPLLAGFTESAAQLLDADYQVAVTSNWWFMIASTVMLTLVGWWVTVYWVEPQTRKFEQGPGCDSISVPLLDSCQKQALLSAALVFLSLLCLVVMAANIPGAPLYGQGARFARWVEVTVPLLFILFIVPAVVYGWRANTVTSGKQMARHLADTLADLGPYIVLAFFASQFIAVFKYTRLGEMLALSGGSWLSSLQIDVTLLILGFVLLACLGNMLIGSMSAKYAFMAPVFVPMLMQAGVAPELTQVAYRIGDSVTNVITPLNPYMVIILAMLQKYQRHAGIGTLISLTLPYSMAFLAGWLMLLSLWVFMAWPLGPGHAF